MPYDFFQIPADNSGSEAERLNQFLKTHRVVKIEKQFFTDGKNAYWSFCVSWLDGPSSAQPTKQDKRVDYRESLTEPQFTVYSALRELRKEVAESDGVPVYAVATNEHLAEMVRRNCRSLASLQKIAGFGKNKADRYGDKFLALLRERMDTSADEPPDAK